MGLFDRFKKREINDDSFDPLLKVIINNNKIDRQDALEIPAVSSCVELICNTFAMIPFKLYQESNVNGKKETKEVSEDNRVKLINDDTTDMLDGFQFKKAICEDYLLGKGGYAYIKKNKNQFIGLFYVENNSVSILKNSDPIFKNFDILVNGKSYKNYQFIKLLRNTKDGASGIGLK